MEGTLMSFDVRMTLAELGGDPANGEWFLEAFLAVAPQTDPVVSQNLDDKTLTISVSCDAANPAAAVKVATQLLHEVVGRNDHEMIEVNAELLAAA
jgi:hypothetical protein